MLLKGVTVVLLHCVSLQPQLQDYQALWQLQIQSKAHCSCEHQQVVVFVTGTGETWDVAPAGTLKYVAINICF